MYRVVISTEQVNNKRSTHLRRVISEDSAQQSGIQSMIGGELHLLKDTKPEGSMIRHSRMLLVLYVRQETISQFHKVQFESLDIIRDRQNLHILIVFTHVNIAQQFQSFLRKQFLTFFLLDALLIQQQPSTTDNLSQRSRSYLQLLHSQSKDSSKQQLSRWVQIPHCIMCLQKLQTEITGIEQSLLHLAKSVECTVCAVVIRDKNKCSECEEAEDIWACVLCGRVGCGRYRNGDAKKHFLDSGHFLSIDLSTQRVWSYLSDAFGHKVHHFDIHPPRLYDVDSALWGYFSLLSQELERQKLYYQTIINKQELSIESRRQGITKQACVNEIMIQEKKQQLKKITKKVKKQQKRKEQIETKIKQHKESIQNSQNIIRNGKQCQEQPIYSSRQEQLKKQILSLDMEIEEQLKKLCY